jgi:hypothetical protein
MKWSWLFNGSLQAHHLAGVYLAVWAIQGGYAARLAWQWTRAGKNSRGTLPRS